jgi:hypothetical protein
LQLALLAALVAEARVNPEVSCLGHLRKMLTVRPQLTGITINLCPSSPEFNPAVWSVLLTFKNPQLGWQLRIADGTQPQTTCESEQI